MIGRTAVAIQDQEVGLGARNAGRISVSRRNAPSDLLEGAALRYLARRDRSEAQMAAYLEHRGASPSKVRTLLRQLRTRGYLNDERFAVSWGQARLARRPMGRQRLEAELLGQGLGPPLVLRVLSRLYREQDEREIARRLLKRKPGNGSLLRRYGFSEETIEAFCGAGTVDD
jgi:regulatory protein